LIKERGFTMKFKTKDLVLAGLFLALGIILPMLFHLAGLSGTVFSPMHIPVLLGGFILGPVLGLIVGILTPIASFLVTGMPPHPFLWTMIIELGVYGLLSGVFYRKLKMNLVIALIGAMIIGRLSGALTAYVLANLFSLKLNAIMFLKGATIVAWPAIVIQLVLIPVVIKVYKQSFQG